MQNDYSKCRGKLFLDIETGMTTNPMAIQYLLNKCGIDSEKEREKAFTELQKTALDPAFGEIHVISTAFEMQEPNTIKRMIGEDEKDFLDRAMYEIGLIISSVTVEKFVAFNAEFDRNFIFKRCLVHGIKIPFSSTTHKNWICPMKMWGNGANEFVSLDKLCIAFNIFAPKEIDGSKVPLLLASGMVDQVAEYCESDVVKRLRPLFIKMERNL